MGKIYDNPRFLTPNQEANKEFYCQKSGDSIEEYEQIPDNHQVYDWNDGSFVDYIVFERKPVGISNGTVERVMNILCFYSPKDTVRKFKEIYKVAVAYKCDSVQFTTWRNRDAFSRILDRMGSKYPIMKPVETTFEMKVGEKR